MTKNQARICVPVRFSDYDLLGKQLSAKDGNGAVTSYTYDTLNRLKSVTQGGNTTTYAYDIVSGDTVKNTVTDARGNVSETVFDLAGRKTADRAGVSGAGAAMTTSYQYNANNQVTLVTRNDGSKEKVTYDSVGQTTRIDYYAAGADTSAASGYYLTYAYDDNGNVTRETVTKDGATEITAYAYDALNRVSQQTQGAEKVGALPIDYAYNAAGQLSGVSYPRENSQTGVAATGTGKQTLSFTYDSYGRQSEVRLNGQLVESYSYTAGGDLMATQVYGKFDAGNTADYLRTAYTYNSLGLVTKTETQGYGSVTGKKEQIDLTYDNVGNIRTEQTYTNYGTAKTVNKSYEYDTVGRLTKSTIDGKATSYTYDAVGNRLTQTSEGKTLTYSYNNLNQLTSIREGNTTVASYTYDANGNQKKETRQHVSVTVGGNTQVYNKETDYTYDLRGLLTGVSVKTPSANEITGEVTYDTQTTTNTYNAAGKRLKRVEEDKTTRFYYMGEALLFTTNQDLVMTSENVLNTGGQIIASKRFAVPGVEATDPFAGQYYFYQYDVRGSVTDILDKNAGLVKGYDYDEFGNTEEKGNESFLNDVTFTGSVSDASSGLQYMNARFYQPSTGRFLSQDSYSGNPYDPWTQHLYSYCGNNPVNMVDPTGHSATGVIGGIWGAALAEPTPFGEIIAAIATIFLGGVIIGEAISNSSSASSSSASAKPKAEAAKSTTIPIDTKIKAQNKFIKRSMEKALGKPKEEATTITIEKELPPEPMQMVYRVYGGDSTLYGHSWTPTDPRMVKNYRDAAGLPSGGMSGSRNTGEYLAIGILHDKTGVKSRLALPLDGNSGGGIIEYEVPCPEMQITIIKIDILDPPL